MKQVSLLLFFLVFKLNTYGQIDFAPDQVKSKTFENIDKNLDNLAKLETDYDFELRLWTEPPFVHNKTVFILRLKKGKWTASYYEVGTSNQIKNKNIDTSSLTLDNLWKRLIENDLLTLPDQSLLNPRMKKYVADTLDILNDEENPIITSMVDGTRYTFELATKTKSRLYSYHCPKSHLQRYSNIEELYHAYAIIVLIRKYLHLNLEVC